MDVTISLKEIDAAYIESLDHSIRQADDERNLISFTMEDFMAYTPKKDAWGKLLLLRMHLMNLMIGLKNIQRLFDTFERWNYL